MAEPHIVSGEVKFVPHGYPSLNDALGILSEVVADAAVQAHRDGVTDPAKVKELVLQAARRLYGIS